MASESCENTMSNIVNEIEETLSHTDKWMADIMTITGWTERHLTKDISAMVRCPIDANHVVPRESFVKHTQYCKLKKAGYSKSELKEESEKPGGKFSYERSNTVVSVDLDDNTIRNVLSRAQGGYPVDEARVLPQTMEHIQDLSREERLVVHQYVIDTATAARRPTTVPLEDLQLLEPDSQSGGPKTENTVLELKMQERDLKRRRQSYRKTVHTSKKSYLEVIHDVIESQCGILREQWSKTIPAEDENSEDSNRSGKVKRKHKKSKKHKRHKSDS